MNIICILYKKMVEPTPTVSTDLNQSMVESALKDAKSKSVFQCFLTDLFNILCFFVANKNPIAQIRANKNHHNVALIVVISSCTVFIAGPENVAINTDSTTRRYDFSFWFIFKSDFKLV